MKWQGDSATVSKKGSSRQGRKAGKGRGKLRHRLGRRVVCGKVKRICCKMDSGKNLCVFLPFFHSYALNTSIFLYFLHTQIRINDTSPSPPPSSSLLFTSPLLLSLITSNFQSYFSHCSHSSLNTLQYARLLISNSTQYYYSSRVGSHISSRPEISSHILVLVCRTVLTSKVILKSVSL